MFPVFPIDNSINWSNGLFFYRFKTVNLRLARLIELTFFRLVLQTGKQVAFGSDRLIGLSIGRTGITPEYDTKSSNSKNTDVLMFGFIVHDAFG